MTTVIEKTDAPETGRFVCPPEHKHDGGWACYRQHGCRCDRCRAFNARKVADWRARAKTGDVDAWVLNTTPAREHVDALHKMGMPLGLIAERAGVSGRCITELLAYRSSQLTPYVNDALLGVTYVAPKPRAVDHVDPTGTRRRIQALIAIGWTFDDLAAQMGFSDRNLSRTIGASFVTVRVERTVRDVYDRLWHVVPADSIGSRRARRRAHVEGWLPPLAWDDDIIDDPKAKPDMKAIASLRAPAITRFEEDAIDAALAGDKPRLSPVERAEAVRILHERRWSAHRIANHIGCAQRTVDRIRNRLELTTFTQREMAEAA